MNLVNSSFSLNLAVLRVLGLFSESDPSIFFFFYGYVLLFVCSLPNPIFGVLYYFQDEELAVLDSEGNFLEIVAMIVTIPKMLLCISSNQKIRECLCYLDLAFNFTLNERQKAITEDCIWVCQRNVRFFYVCLISNEITWICVPLISSYREFPMKLWLPFDATSNGVIFYGVFIFIVTGVNYTIFSNATMDTLISGLVYHAAGQIKILKDNLQFLAEYTEDVISPKLTRDKAIYRKIRECIQHHHHILRFVDKIEDCFSWMLFSQIFASMFMVVCCCIQISQTENGNVNFFPVYLFSLLLQLYFYCYYGTTLYAESNTLATAAYLGQWYEYDLKSQKALMLLMERAKIPMTVTAGKFIDLSLETFANVLKKSYSLLAMLKHY